MICAIDDKIDRSTFGCEYLIAARQRGRPPIIMASKVSKVVAESTSHGRDDELDGARHGETIRRQLSDQEEKFLRAVPYFRLTHLRSCNEITRRQKKHAQHLARFQNIESE